VRRSPRTLLVFCLLAVSGAAHSHARSESYSNWYISGDRMRGVITVSTGEVMTLMTATAPGTLESLFAAHVTETVSVASAEGDCSAQPPVRLDAARGFLRLEVGFDCQGTRPASLEYRALFERLPAHVHYARIFEDGRLLAEQVMTERAGRWAHAGGPGRHSFVAFLDLGIRHILSGVDHIAFLLGMLLVAGTIGRSIAAVTGFTLGHSLSLAAAVLGYLQANGRLVEAFIGFTVALVAVEYFLLRRPETRSLPLIAALTAWITGGLALAAGLISVDAIAAYLGFGAFAFCYLLVATRLSAAYDRSTSLILFVVTACFGLVHGFGFAGFLMDTGLTGTSLALPLFGFNLGVEAGQLALLGLAFVAAYALRNTAADRLAPLGAAALCGVGVFWFVGRSLAA
jgi:hypothetical protein